MRKTILLCAIAAATTLSAAPYRFISFNVWGNFFGNPPSERDVAQTEILREHNPDFIALQEMTADYWASRLVSGLRADYETVGEKMGPDGIDAFIPILYRREGFELLGKGAKWFCRELDTSKGVVWAALRDRRTGDRIVVFSSHFWWRMDGRGDDFIRLENARRLYEEVTAAAAKYDAAIVGGGDLNATGASSALLELKRLGWKDGQETAPGKDTRPTWRDEPVRDSRTGRYRGVTFEAAKRTMTLDHAFYAPERVGAYEFRMDCSQKALDTSDHVPIIFDFTVHPKAEWKEPRKTASLSARPQSDDSAGWWQRRFRAKLNGVWGDRPVVFVGDSSVQGWEGAGERVWQRHFAAGRMVAFNFGFNGDRTEHVLWRIGNGMLDNYRTKAVVLEIGAFGADDGRTLIDVMVGIKAVVDGILARQPEARVVLHPIFPHGAPQDPARLRDEAVNREIARIADGRRVVWCDFNDRLSASGANGSNLDANGYEIWADALLPVLDRILRAEPGESVAGRFAVQPSAPVAPGTPQSCVPVSRFDISGTRGKWWWANRLEEKRNEVANSSGAFDIVMLGDSITHFWEDFTYWSCGRDVLDAMRERYSILNLGYGGDRTPNLLWRCENGELDGYRAKCVMLMIGTNNRDTPEDTAEGIRRILALVARKHPEARTLLLPIFPRGKPDDENRARNEKINAIIRGFADGEKVVWLDFNDRFLQPDGTFRPGLMIDDLLHPHHKGYELWRDAVLPKFQEICGH